MSNIYRTSDLNIAAFLMTRDAKFIGGETADDRRRVFFIFEDAPMNLVRRFFNNENVPVADYCSALRTLRNIIREIRRPKEEGDAPGS